MDVLAQALDVVEQADQDSGRVTLTLDLDQPGQRAAFAAAMAVLRINGIDLSELQRPAPEQPGRPESAPQKEARPEDTTAGEAVPQDAVEAAEAEDDSSQAALDDAVMPTWRAYGEALSELTLDEKRRTRVLHDTFPRVRDLLMDGANVEAVAQVQYHRWVDEHLAAKRN